MEATVSEALCKLWPQPKQRAILRMIAETSIGAMRLGMDAWRDDDGQRPPADYVREGFRQLRIAISSSDG